MSAERKTQEKDTKLYGYLKSRRTTLDRERQHMIPHWKSIRSYLDPLRGRFDETTASQPRLPDYSKIITGYATYASNVLSSGMQSGLTSPSREWFKLSVANPDTATPQVKEWCDAVHERMKKVLVSSNFYDELHSTYQELSDFGNSAFCIEEDEERVIRCKTYTVGTYYVATDYKGMINTFMQERFMTTQQIVNRFEYKNCPGDVQRAWDNEQYDHLYLVYNIVEPDVKSADRRFRSIWFMDEDRGAILGRGFFYDFPVMFPRWNLVPDTVYGFGPGTNALADIRQLMRMQLDRLTGVGKQVAPPLLAHNSLQGQTIYTAPNAITYSGEEGNSIDKSVVPLYSVPLSLSDLQIAIADTRQSINESFHVNMFLMLESRDNPQMTATEITERTTEKMTVLGPVLERLETELLTPAIMRIFGIMSQQGLIPDPPAELVSGQERLKIEYVSILAQAQKLRGIQPLEQLTSYTASLMASFPDVSDKLDWDRIVEHYHDFVGAPADVVKQQEEVAAAREQRAQAMQQAQGVEQMQQGAGAMEQVAKGAELMSNAGERGNETLDQILSSMGY